MKERILEQMKDAEAKAWESLSGYKFLMFGYHAARWVNYHRLLIQAGVPLQPSPFIQLVKLAKEKVGA